MSSRDTAYAMAYPSSVEVPRPSSSRMTSVDDVKSCIILDDPCISERNVLIPFAKLSSPPMRVMTASATLMSHSRAGT